MLVPVWRGECAEHGAEQEQKSRRKGVGDWGPL